MDKVEVSCIACNKPMVLTEENYKQFYIHCWDGNYLICPNCHRAINIISYKGKGRLLDLVNFERIDS